MISCSEGFNQRRFPDLHESDSTLQEMLMATLQAFLRAVCLVLNIWSIDCKHHTDSKYHRPQTSTTASEVDFSKFFDAELYETVILFFHRGVNTILERKRRTKHFRLKQSFSPPAWNLEVAYRAPPSNAFFSLSIRASHMAVQTKRRLRAYIK